MKNNHSVQNNFLDRIINEKRKITLVTINGFQMAGIIRDYDDYTVEVDCHGDVRLVYKQAISTIMNYSPRVERRDI